MPSDPASLARLERAGFAPAGPTLRRPLRGGRSDPPPIAPPGGPDEPAPPNHSRSHSGEERRRLRGRGEHLLRGQGGRRGHRLRHASEVGHRRTRFRPRVCLYRARPGQREPAQLPPVPRPPPVQGRQQGHPQVRRRQGQGEPRHRARGRHDEDRAQPGRGRHRVGRRRLRAGDPRRPGDGRPRRGHQLPRQHLVGPDRGRGPVHGHHPHRQGRQELHALRPPRRGRRRGPVDDRGARQDDRGHRSWTGSRSRPWPGSRRGARDRIARPWPGPRPRSGPRPRPGCGGRRGRRVRWPADRAAGREALPGGIDGGAGRGLRGRARRHRA